MTDILIDGKSLNELKEIFKQHCPDALIWAYGSRVDGTAHFGSDLDLAIVDYRQQGTDYMELKHAIKDSNMTFLTDIFELNKLPESFQREIEANHVVFYDGMAP